MKCFVISPAGFAYALPVIAGLIVGLMDASPGATYLIGLAVTVIGVGILLGPDRVQLWREQHGAIRNKKP